MGIFGALTAAVGGMRAQSYALENISGNIANSQTTAFKREDTSFVDLIQDNIPTQQLAGGVLAMSRPTNTVQGDIQNASVGTFMAISGDGFFVVGKPASFSAGNPVFDGVQLYTRRGDFQLDRNGYLVNGAGYYLMGIPIDPTTGNVVGSVPEMLQFNTGFLPANVTTSVQYQANLAAYPNTPSADPTVPDSELLNPASFGTNPTVAGTGTVVGSDLNTFIGQSIGGGAITVYDQVGQPANLQFRWAKVDTSLTGGTDTWELFYQTNSTATGATVAWQNAGVDFTFGANGQLSPAVSSTTLSGVVVDGLTIGDVAVQFGSSGLTQFADTNGTVQVSQLQQNGYAAGKLVSIAVSDKGTVTGTFSNSRTIDLAQITLANFLGTNWLKRLDGGAFAETEGSGPALYNASGKILGSSLEGSNTDIADEFTKLIVTQQAYSANTRVITTSNQMVQDMLNMLR